MSPTPVLLTSLSDPPKAEHLESLNGKNFSFVRPWIPPVSEWMPYLEATYQARFFSNLGPAARQLEQQLTEKYGLGEREAVLVSSCSAGLLASLLALGRRGRVLLPSFTFPATAHAICLAGCEPVFCDVSAATWELDPECVRAELKKNGAIAVLHVRTYGFCRDLHVTEDVCREFDVPLLVDAAASLGGWITANTPPGHAGEMEVFSMHATKVFNVGEGGVIFAPPEWAKKIRPIINHGITQEQTIAPGINGKMSEFHAAIGLSVLPHIDTMIAHRAEMGQLYRELMQSRGLGFIEHPASPGDMPWQLYAIRLPRDFDTLKIQRRLRARFMETRRYYSALHCSPFFGNGANLPVTCELANSVLCLPLYSDIQPEEVSEMVDRLQSAIDFAAGTKESPSEAAYSNRLPRPR